MAFATTFRHSPTEPVRGREVDTNFDALGVYTDATFLPLTGGVIAWTGTISGAWDGWIGANQTWAYASATTITVPTGAAAIYGVGDKIKITQTTVKYFYVTAVADTVLTVNGGISYAVANATITFPSYSKMDTPLLWDKANFRSSVVASVGNGHGSTNTRIRRFTSSTTVGSAITYADSSTLGGSFTVNEPGWYAVAYSDSRAGGAGNFGLSVNGTSLTTNIDSLTIANGKVAVTAAPAATLALCSASMFLSAGDVIRPHDTGSQDNTTDDMIMSVTKINGYGI